MKRLYSRPKREKRAAGFTLLEVMIALAALTVGILGYSKAVVDVARSARKEREATLAFAAARQVISQIQATNFADLYASFNVNQADDPVGAPGAFFDIDGLEPQLNAPGGRVGQITLPTINFGGAEQLREDAVNPLLGCPRDLNGDGAIDAIDHSADYIVLPILVTVRWTGSTGEGQVQLRTTLANY